MSTGAPWPPVTASMWIFGLPEVVAEFGGHRCANEGLRNDLERAPFLEDSKLRSSSAFASRPIRNKVPQREMDGCSSREKSAPGEGVLDHRLFRRRHPSGRRGPLGVCTRTSGFTRHRRPGGRRSRLDSVVAPILSREGHRRRKSTTGVTSQATPSGRWPKMILHGPKFHPQDATAATIAPARADLSEQPQQLSVLERALRSAPLSPASRSRPTRSPTFASRSRS